MCVYDWIRRPKETLMRKILFPVEDMNPSQKALDLAIELAQGYEAEILILHVQPYSEPLSYPYAHLTEPWDEDAFNQVSERIVANAVSLFRETGLVVTTRITSGNPASEILESAGDENCDLIIMCTHGMGTIKRFLLGSVTNKVVLHAKIPVLVVR